MRLTDDQALRAENLAEPGADGALDAHVVVDAEERCAQVPVLIVPAGVLAQVHGEHADEVEHVVHHHCAAALPLLGVLGQCGHR